MRIAACQMVSGTSIEENVKTARSLIISAAENHIRRGKRGRVGCPSGILLSHAERWKGSFKSR